MHEAFRVTIAFVAQQGQKRFVNDQTLSIIATILLAFIGFAVKYWNDLTFAHRKDQLDRVNQQLKNLYGPLYATDQAAKEAWIAFRKVYRPNLRFWASDPPPTEEEIAAWRLWMSEVFMPLNLRMEKIIVENADLLEETEMPGCFLQLCAHVATYKAVIKRWESGDFSQQLSSVNYPGHEFRDYVTTSFVSLKRRQAKLLNQLGKMKKS